MRKALALIDPAAWALIQSSLDNNPQLNPFAREILLLECRIAGTRYQDIMDIEDELHPGDSLLLLREPDNAFDPLAIKILDGRGRHLGYVPRVKNEPLARLMDAGKQLFGKVEGKYWQGDWLCIVSRIYMRDY